MTFHLHLFCDLLGSRGPTPHDLWPVFYLGPLTRHPMWTWVHQWPLDGWQNRIISIALFFGVLWMAMGRGDSVVGVFSRRADNVFVGILRKWREAFVDRFALRRG